MNSAKYHVAVDHFSTVLSLNPRNRIDILSKRSTARASMNSWEEALSDADEVCFGTLSLSNCVGNRVRRSSNLAHHPIGDTS